MYKGFTDWWWALHENQLNEIDKALQTGETPDEIAKRLGISQTALRYQLLTSGKRIVTYRRLEDTAPADNPRELATA